ncbi:hypothetical protein TRFO_34386 [Tritrichomonas foetus]|uniref:Uncharacterized protein n=1 Tax=Tritrichomonas foetus TaxID=1144522 RepID=A0A1J4JNV5_9EUKA|nr:hypothetical protein TRFO_34386 [Tritrichomonas foetus]|eukprot:OHS99205.1 hypothetical protein TRFO_34386 [Tritrichomonas foetus]
MVIFGFILMVFEIGQIESNTISATCAISSLDASGESTSNFTFISLKHLGFFCHSPEIVDFMELILILLSSKIYLTLSHAETPSANSKKLIADGADPSFDVDVKKHRLGVEQSHSSPFICLTNTDDLLFVLGRFIYVEILNNYQKLISELLTRYN